MYLPALEIHEPQTESCSGRRHISVDVLSLEYAGALFLVRT